MGSFQGCDTGARYMSAADTRLYTPPRRNRFFFVSLSAQILDLWMLCLHTETIVLPWLPLLQSQCRITPSPNTEVCSSWVSDYMAMSSACIRSVVPDGYPLVGGWNAIKYQILDPLKNQISDIRPPKKNQISDCEVGEPGHAFGAVEFRLEKQANVFMNSEQDYLTKCEIWLVFKEHFVYVCWK